MIIERDSFTGFALVERVPDPKPDNPNATKLINIKDRSDYLPNQDHQATFNRHKILESHHEELERLNLLQEGQVVDTTQRYAEAQKAIIDEVIREHKASLRIKELLLTSYGIKK